MEAIVVHSSPPRPSQYSSSSQSPPVQPKGHRNVRARDRIHVPPSGLTRLPSAALGKTKCKSSTIDTTSPESRPREQEWPTGQNRQARTSDGSRKAGKAAGKTKATGRTIDDDDGPDISAYEKFHAVLEGRFQRDTTPMSSIDSPDPIDSLGSPSPPVTPVKPKSKKQGPSNGVKKAGCGTLSGKENRKDIDYPKAEPTVSKRRRESRNIAREDESDNDATPRPVPREERRAKKPRESKKATPLTSTSSEANAFYSSASLLDKVVKTGAATAVPASKSIPRFRKKGEEAYDAADFARAQKARTVTDHNFFNTVEAPVIPMVAEANARYAEMLEKEEAEEAERLREESKLREEKAELANSFFSTSRPTRVDPALVKFNSAASDFFNDSTPKKAPELEDLTMSPVTKASLDDRLFCSRYIDERNLCPYCSEPMPTSPSAELLAMRAVLSKSDRTLHWRHTGNFCGMHRAETSIIPLGWRDGYPDDIDFVLLDRRLDEGFIRTRLRRVIDQPDLSKFYRRTKRQIQSKGLAAWQRMASQASVLSMATPGYYGGLGQKIIIQHFQQLHSWGHLPTLDTDAIYPLSASDFIITVLVPEAVLLLIMQDKGWNSSKCKGDAWTTARDAAQEVRHKSAEYGRWRYREEGEAGKQVLETLAARVSKKTKRVEDCRKKELAASRVKKTAGGGSHHPIDIADMPSSSDAGSADPSEYGDDSDFWGQALAVVAPTINKTPTASRTASSKALRQSSSLSNYGDEIWEDGTFTSALHGLSQTEKR